jgi:hypothetical protein
LVGGVEEDRENVSYRNAYGKNRKMSKLIDLYMFAECGVAEEYRRVG